MQKLIDIGYQLENSICYIFKEIRKIAPIVIEAKFFVLIVLVSFDFYTD